LHTRDSYAFYWSTGWGSQMEIRSGRYTCTRLCPGVASGHATASGGEGSG
jgi:hypothetical protein